MKKIFFAASTYAVPELLNNYLRIIKEIKKNNAKVNLDWTKDWKDVAKKYKKRGVAEMKESDVLKVVNRRKFFEEHMESILNCDALVAEVTRPTISVGYQIFLAISHKKPVLALYTDINDLKLSSIKSIINTKSPLVQLRRYNKKSLPIIIKSFINKQKLILKKFNFLISEEINKYIIWLKKKEPALSKSELLRNKIMDEILIYDKKYQDYLKDL